MPGSSQVSIAKCWWPFLGKKMGLAKNLTLLSIDPDDLPLHHVFPTTTSLCRLLGLSAEFEPRAGGAGILLVDAVNRAMGELVERYASVAYDGSRKILASRNTLLSRGCRVIPSDNLALFSSEQLLTPGFGYTNFTDDTEIGWIEGTNLADGSQIFVPGQLVSMGYVPDLNEVSSCFYPTSSGCAVAPSVDGAVLAGLLESIERDAVMIRWYARIAPPMLDLDIEELLGKPPGPQTQGLDIRFHDMTVDGDVPVVSVTCIERTGRPCFFLLSAAAGLDTLTAARKALVEAGQGRPFIKLLANINRAPHEGHEFSDFDSNLRFYAEPANAHYTEWFLSKAGEPGRYFPEVSDAGNAGDRLHILLDRCSAMELTPIVFDFTTPEIRDCGLFACRVLVPELVPLAVPSAPFLGHPRLARYIAEGELAGRTECIPKWVPHPFP
jgi:ribosomal protein S12 methylthiotransferase accessory factor